MAYALTRYTGNGTLATYTIGFTYRSTDDVKVYVGGVLQTITTHYSFPTSSQITFVTPPSNGVAIVIRRNTSQSSRLVDYSAGSVLKESDLDTDSIQGFNMAQESIDISNDSITKSDSTNQWDATSLRVTNVTDPTSAQDAATKNYVENTWLTLADKAQLNSLNTTNLNTVATNIANVNAVAADATDIGTVSTNIASVNTVATNINDVITVANDLNEAISEIETAADDLNEAVSDIDTVSTNIANVNTVGGAITNVNTVATNIGNVNTVGGNITNVNTVGGISGNVSTVAGISSDVTAVAGDATDIGTVSTNIANVNIVAGNNSNVSTVAGISGNVTTVAGIQANVTTVAGISANVTTVANDATDIGTVATNIANVNSVGGSIANVNTVASNLASVNNFGEVYRIASSAPTTSLDLGDLYFDTTSDTLKVYGASGWQNAGSSVNGTSQRYHYDITGTPTSVTGADANGNTLAYDAGYVDVYVNGVRMSTADVTVTSGDTVTFASALANGDEVDIVGYGTFNVASLNADNLDSGTVPSARVSGAYTGITSVGTLTSFASTGIDDNASSTAVTINVSGKVGLGIDPSTLPSFISHAIKIANGGGLSITSPSSGDNRYIFFGTGTSSADVQLAAIKNSSSDLMFLGAGGSEKMRVTSNGLTFNGDTAAANALDDYEEGTWTPQLTDLTNNATMHSLNGGVYTKIGRLVSCTANVRTTSLGSVSGALYLTGFPFASANTNGNQGAGSVANAENMNITAGHSIQIFYSKNGSQARWDLYDSTGGITALQASEWSSDGQASIQVTYST